MSRGAEIDRRTLMIGWGASATLLVAGLAILLLSSATLVGGALFAVGAVASLAVTAGVLRARR